MILVCTIGFSDMRDLMVWSEITFVSEIQDGRLL